VRVALFFLKKVMKQPIPQRWARYLADTGRVMFTPKMAAMFFFGFASGFPFYIVKDVLKAWMTDAQVDLATIGLFSAVGLPYTLKFVWAPLMDRFIPPFLGRRRGWILIAQIGLMLTIAGLGQFDPENFLVWIAVMALAVSFFGASQDISLDAFRREYLTDEELGFGTGVWMNAWRLGMYVSIGVAFLMADENIGWGRIHIVLALMMAVGVITTLLVSEPEVAGGPPPSLNDAIVQPFVEFFRRDGAVLVLLFILFYKIGDNMAAAMNIPFILKMGFSKTEYLVIVKGLGMLGLFGGVLLGGAVMIRLGIARSLWVFGVLQAVSTAGFSLLVLFDHGTSFWETYRHHLLGGIVCFEFFATGLGQAAYATYMAVKTNKQFTATQYALLTSLMAVPGVVAASVTGFAAEFLGWCGFYIMCALAALPGMLLLVVLAPWNATNEELDVSNS
jgi:MFS transporter, PAT family, beta-lactamase induction signal transducer AmpG